MTRGQRGTLAMPNCAAASAIWFVELSLAGRMACVGLVRQPGVCVSKLSSKASKLSNTHTHKNTHTHTQWRCTTARLRLLLL